ncbi:MAG TPA: hypothetical protein VGF71_03645 [Caulobacteraceae bacterium]|jgi:hypothetical protein
MSEQLTYQSLLEASRRANWRIADIIGGNKKLDFTKCFLPETYVRAGSLEFLNPGERLLLNHIRSRGYLAMFELLEQVIVPFMSDQARDAPDAESFRAPALRNLVREENKHRELFRRFLAEFDQSFGVECGLIGPAPDIVAAFLAHGAMGVTIAVLALEWMSQDHYVESIKDDRTLDPHFKSLLKHHWEEEFQHARLDELLLKSMAAASAPTEIDHAVDEFFDIGAFLDGGLGQQAALDLEAFQRAAGRRLTAAEHEEFLRQQHQALRWTFLGTTLRNANFLDVTESLGGTARRRLEAAAGAYSIN